jgi:hypothetical protein
MEIAWSVLVIVCISGFIWFTKWASGFTWRQIAMIYGGITAVLAVTLLVGVNPLKPDGMGAMILLMLAALPFGGYLAIRDHRAANKLASSKDQS